MCKMRKRCSSSTHGFTLIELLVAVAISGIVMAAIYSAYYTAQKNAIVQEDTAVMRQNLRAGLDLMAREIRMAGYDPAGTANAGITTAGSNSIIFTSDLDGDGAIAADENITYALSGTELQRNGQAVAENIDALHFDYLPSATPDAIRSVQITLVARADNPDRDYTDTNTYSNPQGWSYTPNQDIQHYRRRLLTTRVVCRNLGLD
jgi:type IV pilus assembly protein PilW